MVRLPPVKGEKPVRWIGSAKADLMQLPSEVRDKFGFALGAAQYGAKSAKAKPWKGEGPGVWEIAEEHEGNAFRLIYTVRLKPAIVVLHVFQKKSRSGVKTDLSDVEIIGKRLKAAKAEHKVAQALEQKQ
jgi:phage-related protein